MMEAWLKEFAEYLRSTGVTLPDGWLPFSFDASPDVAPPGFMKITGSVPIGKKRNGRPKWGPKKESQSYFVDNAKMAEWKHKREQAAIPVA